MKKFLFSLDNELLMVIPEALVQLVMEQCLFVKCLWFVCVVWGFFCWYHPFDRKLMLTLVGHSWFYFQIQD